MELPAVEMKFGKSLGLADRLKARHAVIVGDDENSRQGLFTVKRLSDGTQQKLGEPELFSYLRGTQSARGLEYLPYRAAVARLFRGGVFKRNQARAQQKPPASEEAGYSNSACFAGGHNAVQPRSQIELNRKDTKLFVTRFTRNIATNTLLRRNARGGRGQGSCGDGLGGARRDLGKLLFIDLRDRSGMAQMVFNKEQHAEAHRRAEEVRSEFVVAVREGDKRNKVNPGAAHRRSGNYRDAAAHPEHGEDAAVRDGRRYDRQRRDAAPLPLSGLAAHQAASQSGTAPS